VAGLTLLNDVSMRDYQRRSLQWFAGKSWERATPVGPVVVTLDELPNLGEREIVTRVNGVERQRAPIGDLLFDIPTLIADLSKIITLRPGDLIATGTPDGVGHGMKPPSYLQSGDEVVVSLDGIGELRSRFEQGT
jgi:acylpyruvate hydrolase